MPIETRAARAFEALLRGDTTVTSGPLVELTVDGQRPGATVKARGGHVRAHVRVSAAAWVPVDEVEVWRDDEVVAHFAVPGGAFDGVRFERDVDIAVKADAVVLAWAQASTPLPDVMPLANARAIGFTSLVRVDADGDGKVKVPPAK